MAEIEESQEPEENFIEEEPPAKRPYYFQLDVLKAIAIAFVVMDHSPVSYTHLTLPTSDLV